MVPRQTVGSDASSGVRGSFSERTWWPPDDEDGAFFDPACLGAGPVGQWLEGAILFDCRGYRLMSRLANLNLGVAVTPSEVRRPG